MIKNLHKFQGGSQVEQSSLASFKQVQTWKGKKASLKQKLLPIGVLAFLGMWISLCLLHGGFLLDKALICSAIITCLLFFRTAEQADGLQDQN